MKDTFRNICMLCVSKFERNTISFWKKKHIFQFQFHPFQFQFKIPVNMPSCWDDFYLPIPIPRPTAVPSAHGSTGTPQLQLLTPTPLSTCPAADTTSTSAPYHLVELSLLHQYIKKLPPEFKTLCDHTVVPVHKGAVRTKSFSCTNPNGIGLCIFIDACWLLRLDR